MKGIKWTKLNPEQQAAYRWGLLIAVISGVILLLPASEDWHAAGPHNTGHTDIDCTECHAPATGNFAGQALKNMLHAVGLSDSATPFTYTPAGNDQCLACHDNPDDRHPVAKFMETEFASARETAGVQSCLGCHQQHRGVRVTVHAGVCQNCHQDTAMSDDPVDIPHTTLIRDQRWGTCLGCHDFHGNHDRAAPKRMAELLSEEQIQQYFDGGTSPYGHRRLTVIQTMRRR